MNKFLSILAAALIILVIALDHTVNADYYLFTIDLDRNEDGHPAIVDIKPFIAKSDCRREGFRTMKIVKSFGGRAGFYCEYVEQ